VIEIVGIIEAMVRKLDAAGAQESIFDEMASVSRATFDFQSKVAPYRASTMYAKRMLHLCGAGAETFACSKEGRGNRFVLSNGASGLRFDPSVIESVVSEFASATPFVIGVSKRHARGADKKERWYSTEFAAGELSRVIIEADSLSLPAPNMYLPSSYELLPSPGISFDGDAPAILDGDETKARDVVYYSHCNKFGKPKAGVHFKFWNPLLRRSAATSTHSSLFSELLFDILTERFYSAEVAGLSYHIHAQGLSALGFNDKLPALVAHLASALTRNSDDYFLADEAKCRARFETLLERALRRRQSFVKKRPMSIASSLVSWMLYEDQASHEELLAALGKTTWESFLGFCESAAFQQSNMIVDQLAVGNLLPEQVAAMHDDVRSAVSTWGTSPSEVGCRPARRVERIIQIPCKQPIVLEADAWNEKERNGACIVEWQMGDSPDLALSARVALLVSIMKQKAFAELRTKQQLGYVVQTSSRNHYGVSGMRILIQSKTTSPDVVAKRIDEFLASFRREHLLGGENPIDVSTYKASLRQKLLDPDKTVYETFSRVRRAFVAPRDLLWDRNAKLAREVECISAQDLADFFDEYVSRDGPRCRQLWALIRRGEDDKEKSDLRFLENAELISLATAAAWKAKQARIGELSLGPSKM